jgi:hypothetical protein
MLLMVLLPAVMLCCCETAAALVRHLTNIFTAVVHRDSVTFAISPAQTRDVDDDPVIELLSASNHLLLFSHFIHNKVLASKIKATCPVILNLLNG